MYYIPDQKYKRAAKAVEELSEKKKLILMEQKSLCVN